MGRRNRLENNQHMPVSDELETFIFFFFKFFPHDVALLFLDSRVLC